MGDDSGCGFVASIEVKAEGAAVEVEAVGHPAYVGFVLECDGVLDEHAAEHIKTSEGSPSIRRQWLGVGGRVGEGLLRVRGEVGVRVRVEVRVRVRVVVGMGAGGAVQGVEEVVDFLLERSRGGGSRQRAQGEG